MDAPDAPKAAGGLSDALRHKYGPLPGWAWGGIGALALVLVMRGHGGGSSAAAAGPLQPADQGTVTAGAGLDGGGGGGGGAPPDAYGSIYGTDPLAGQYLDPFSPTSYAGSTAATPAIAPELPAGAINLGPDAQGGYIAQDANGNWYVHLGGPSGANIGHAYVPPASDRYGDRSAGLIDPRITITPPSSPAPVKVNPFVQAYKAAGIAEPPRIVTATQSFAPPVPVQPAKPITIGGDTVHVFDTGGGSELALLKYGR